MTGDLERLAERVESATGADDALNLAVHDALGVPVKTGGPVCPRNGPVLYPIRYTASLDAVLALVAEKLPGWFWEVDSAGNASLLSCGDDGLRQPGMPAAHAQAATPALALLAALLRALSAQPKSTEVDRDH